MEKASAVVRTENTYRLRTVQAQPDDVQKAGSWSGPGTRCLKSRGDADRQLEPAVEVVTDRRAMTYVDVLPDARD